MFKRLKKKIRKEDSYEKILDNEMSNYEFEPASPPKNLRKGKSGKL